MLFIQLLAAWLGALTGATGVAGAHDFHVSRLVANHDVAAGQLQLTLDTFVDDLEAAISREGARAGISLAADDVNLFQAGEAPSADSLLARYLAGALRLTCPGGEPALTVLGREPADDPYAAYLYMRFDLACDPTALELVLTSDFLLDLYDDQQNIVVWQRDGAAVAHDLLTAARRAASYEPAP